MKRRSNTRTKRSRSKKQVSSANSSTNASFSNSSSVSQSPSPTPSDVSSTAPETKCPHINDINTKKLGKIKHPSEWSCMECGQTYDLYLCLVCGYLGCGRETQAHTRRHAKKTQHHIVIDINKKACHCYKCNCWVMTDTEGKDLQNVRSLLDTIHSGNIPQDDSLAKVEKKKRRRQDEPKIVTRAQANRQRDQDQQLAALKFWQYKLLAHVFAAWLKYGNVAKIKNEKKNPIFSLPKTTNDDTTLDLPVSSQEISPATKTLLTVCVSPMQLLSRKDKEGVWKEVSKRSIDSAMQLQLPKSKVFRPQIRRQMSEGAIARSLMAGRAGMRNLGNTCYLNAVIQALSNTKVFRAFFISAYDHSRRNHVLTTGEAIRATYGDLSQKKKKRKGRDEKPLLKRLNTTECYEQVKTKGPPKKTQTLTKEDNLCGLNLCDEVHNVLRVIWSGRWSVITPYALIHTIWKLVPRFKGYRQQDAHEFFNCLADKLQEELLNLNINIPELCKSLPDIEAYFNIDLEKVSNRPLAHSPRKSESLKVRKRANDLIYHVFEGSMRNFVKCSYPGCNYVSSHFDSFLCLSLDIPFQYQGRSYCTGSKDLKKGSLRSSGRKRGEDSLLAHLKYKSEKSKEKAREREEAKKIQERELKAKERAKARRKAKRADPNWSEARERELKKQRSEKLKQAKQNKKKLEDEKEIKIKTLTMGTIDIHPLFLTSNRLFTCDVCGIEGEALQSSWHCSKCDFDCCKRCGRGGKINEIKMTSKELREQTNNEKKLQRERELEQTQGLKGGGESIADRHRNKNRRGSKKNTSTSSCSIEQCMKSLLKTEFLKGNSQYYCSRCKTKRDAVKCCEFARLPAVLVIHINRAKWTRGYTRQKLMDHVSFPLEGLKVPITNSKKSEEIYDLAAVVNHHGTGIDTGHYTAYCRNTINGTWNLFNDTHVKPVSAHDVAASQAYLLFYERRLGENPPLLRTPIIKPMKTMSGVEPEKFSL